MTTTEGIWRIAAGHYHGDPCETPSLSASIASVLCHASPLHAWQRHPKLNPDFRPDHDPKYDVGNVAHALLLEGVPLEDACDVVDADDWRTKAAREQRNLARENGKVPLLRKDLAAVEALVESVTDQLGRHAARPPLLEDGAPEQTLVWREDGVLCRAMLDWLRHDYAAIDDLKTTGRSAEPYAFERALYGLGYDLKAAFYIRAVEAITGVTPRFRWIVVETTPPYALSVVEPGPDVLAIGRKKCQYALEVWRRCLARNDWPGYPADVVTATLPPWEESRWLEKEEREWQARSAA